MTTYADTQPPGDCVRGIVCNRCNTLAGDIEKDLQRFIAVIRYIGPKA